MTPSSSRVKLLAVLLAGVAHAALAVGLGLAPPVPVAEQGGAGAAEVPLGSAFADLAQGVITAQVADPIALPVATPETVQPVAPTPALQAVRDLSVEPVIPAPPIPMAQSVPGNPVAGAQPVLPLATVAEPPTESIAALPDPSPAPQATQRPRARPDPAPAATERPREPPKPVAKGNNTKATAAAGASSGREAAKATTRGTGTAQAAGNAAASNYPGQVKRKVDRVRRPKLTARGAVTVSFSVADGGDLATARVAQSSGHAALDQAAVWIVQQAAPFPAPPAGARRTFSIRIVWK